MFDKILNQIINKLELVERESKKTKEYVFNSPEDLRKVNEIRKSLHVGRRFCPSCGMSREECRKCFHQIGERCCTKCRDYMNGILSQEDYLKSREEYTKDVLKHEEDYMRHVLSREDFEVYMKSREKPKEIEKEEK